MNQLLLMLANLANGLQTNPMTKITKAFARFPILLEVFKHWREESLQIVDVHPLGIYLRQPSLSGTTSQPNLITFGETTNKADFCHVGTGATIGAASHPDHKLLVRQA